MTAPLQKQQQGKSSESPQTKMSVRSAVGNLGMARHAALRAGCDCGGTCLDCAQHGAGNLQTLSRVQAKLNVSSPGDLLEQEAEHVAGQVVGAAFLNGGPPLAIQRVSSAAGPGIQKAGAMTAHMGPAEEQLVNESLSGGQPLRDADRSFLEPRFGSDLSSVRVHTDERAARAAKALDAKAFTVGRDIAFAPGQYRPGTRSGMKLLAHEVTHTIQQKGHGPSVQRTLGDGHDLTSPRFAGDLVLEACFDNERVLQFGDTGPAVATIQHALVEFGFALPDFGVDGIFAAETRQAVRDFQTFHGLTGAAVDGRIGRTTMGLFDTTMTTAPAAGPAPIPNVPAPSGRAPTLSATVTTPATPGNCGNMNYVITWNLSGNAGRRGGFVLQDITIAWGALDCTGAFINVVPAFASPLHYYEAWRVAPNSTTFSPVATDTFFFNPSGPGLCSRGIMVFNGVARYHDNVANLPGHMIANNPATAAGGLQSSLADPNVGGDVSPTMNHVLIFHWNCCGGAGGACNTAPTVLILQNP
jgi:peptidoglycan hydrolase-like protein with peptidoglycan-binding domain